jgi:hypothetical protein
MKNTENHATSPLIQANDSAPDSSERITNLNQIPRGILEVISDVHRDVGDLESANKVDSFIASLKPTDLLSSPLTHLREDADLADMGRPLKYQYKDTEN